MPEETNGPLDTSLDLSNVKTAIPMVMEGHYATWRLTELKTKTTEKGRVIGCTYDLVDPAPDTDGGTILPGAMGSKFFDDIQLYSKPDSKKPTWFMEKLAKVVDGLLGTGDKGNSKGKPERPPVNIGTDEGVAQLAQLLLGKTVVVKMKVRTGEYVGNEFGLITFPGDIQA